MMADFITRMVSRTFGLSNVVLPLTAPIFADNNTTIEASPENLSLKKRGADLAENDETPPFSEIQPPSVKAETEEKSAFPTKENQTNEPGMTESNRIATSYNRSNDNNENREHLFPKKLRTPERNLLLPPVNTVENNVSDDRNQKKDFFLLQPEKAEKHANPSPKKARGRTLEQMQVSENLAVSNEQLLASIDSGEKEKPVLRQPAVPDNRLLTTKKSGTGDKPFERKVSAIAPSESGSLIHASQAAEGGKDQTLASRGFARSERTHNLEPPPPVLPDRFSGQSETSSAAPTIKVTIGRVDVRAVMQKAESTPSRRVAPRQPKLSLEDYLQQRSGGER